jgi:hypothetical protein
MFKTSNSCVRTAHAGKHVNERTNTHIPSYNVFYWHSCYINNGFLSGNNYEMNI